MFYNIGPSLLGPFVSYEEKCYEYGSRVLESLLSQINFSWHSKVQGEISTLEVSASMLCICCVFVEKRPSLKLEVWMPSLAPGKATHNSKVFLANGGHAWRQTVNTTTVDIMTLGITNKNATFSMKDTQYTVIQR